MCDMTLEVKDTLGNQSSKSPGEHSDLKIRNGHKTPIHMKLNTKDLKIHR